MARLKNWKTGLGVMIAVIMLVWPTAHIVMSKYFGLNSWKLSGWGMYASVHPTDTVLNVFIVGPGSEPLAQMDVGSLVTRNWPLLFENGETITLDESAFTDGIQTVDWGAIRTDIAVFRRESDVREITEQTVTHLQEPVDIAYVLYFVTQPRLNILTQMAYTESEVYLIKDTCIRNLGVYQSSAGNIEDMLNQIESRAIPLSTAWSTNGCHAGTL